MWRPIAALLLAAAIAEPAAARMHAPYRGHRIQPATAALDTFIQPAGAYSFRKLKSNYAGPAAKIRRTTGGTSDIGFTGTGDFDTAAATAFCAATTCYIDTWYDQSGNGRHLAQTTATSAAQPQLIFNCIGDKPCHRMTLSSQALYQAGPLAPVGSLSASIVSRRADATQPACFMWVAGGNQTIGTRNNVAGLQVSGLAGTSITTSHPDAWHATTGVISGASSSLAVDGVATTGTVTLDTAGGAIAAWGNTGTCDQTEAVIWGSYALSSAERTALQDNQRNYWIPAPLDTFATPSGAYSFRKLKSTYSGPAIRIRRASDNLETDINFLGCTGFTGCPWDEAAANAHCAATSCFVVTRYDQSGNVRDVTGVAAAQPKLVFNCIGSLPCMQADSTNHVLASVGNLTPATGVMTLNVVGKRQQGLTLSMSMLRANGTSGNRLRTATTAATWQLVGGSSGLPTVAATDLAWHSGIAVLNGASSSITIDGATTAGLTANGSVAAGQISVAGGLTGGILQQAEEVLWDNYVLTAGEIAVLTANQRSFWGF